MESRIIRYKTAAKEYSEAIGIECAYLNIEQGNEVDSRCSFCKSPEKLNQAIEEVCSNFRSFSMYQSERFGGEYIYLCPMSLCHWCSPVMFEGIMTGGFIAGPVLLTSIDDFLLEETGRKLDLPDNKLYLLAEQYSRVPLVDPGRAKSLSRLLFYTAIANSDKETSDFFKDQEAFSQQSQIGEYIHLIKTMEGDKRSDLEYPIEQEKKLLRYITMGKKDEARSVLNSILAKILSGHGADLDLFKSRILELAVLISRAAMEGGADVEQVFGLNFNYLKQIRSFTDSEQLTAWVDRIMTRFINLVFDFSKVRHTDTLLQVIKYMREHFYEKISLQDAAGQAGLNPQYFSRMFKGEIGVSFTNYLNRLRVEEAKRLLKSSHMNLGDIAYATGFEDQSYFTKVFKKTVSLTPGEYRLNIHSYPENTHELHESGEIEEL